MSDRVIRIATRKSALALWQAEYVKAKLLLAHPDISVELVPMSTQGDKILDTPLAKIGGNDRRQLAEKHDPPAPD